jgi:hypothetical protein
VALAKFRLIERLADLKTNGLRKLAKLFPGVAHPSDRLSFHPFTGYINVDIEANGELLKAAVRRISPVWGTRKTAGITLTTR